MPESTARVGEVAEHQQLARPRRSPPRTAVRRSPPTRPSTSRWRGCRMCESPGAAPCPGKCLSVEQRLTRSRPRPRPSTRATPASRRRAECAPVDEHAGIGRDVGDDAEVHADPRAQHEGAAAGEGVAAGIGGMVLERDAEGNVSHGSRVTSPPSSSIAMRGGKRRVEGERRRHARAAAASDAGRSRPSG